MKLIMNNKEESHSVIKGGYVPMPRTIYRDYYNGKITKPERNLLMWIRLTADMRGVCHCSMKGLAEDAFNNSVSVSYTNKLLRSLMSKRYLWYQDRNGRRGTFEVHVSDWLQKGGGVKKIDHLFGEDASCELDMNGSESTSIAENKKSPVKESKTSESKYPNAPAVLAAFKEVLGRQPANWRGNKSQLQACQNLYEERGLKSVTNALRYYKEHEGEPYLPFISSPYDLDSKWSKLGNNKLRRNGG